MRAFLLVQLVGWIGLFGLWQNHHDALDRLASQQRLTVVLTGPCPQRGEVEILWNRLYPGLTHSALARWRQSGSDSDRAAQELLVAIPPYATERELLIGRRQKLELASVLFLAVSLAVSAKGLVHRIVPTRKEPSSLFSPPLLRAMSAYLIVISPQGRIVAVNQATCEALGYQEADLLGKSYQDVHGERSELLTMASRRDLEGVYRTRSGQQIPVVIACSLMQHDGKTQALITLAQDVSEQQRTAAELDSSESRLRQLLARYVTSQEEERRKLARDLHDGMQQYLVAAQFHLHILGKDLPSQPSEILERVHSHLGSAIDEGRRLIRNLRPPGLEELGLECSLRRLLEQAAHDCDWQIDLEITLGGPPLSQPLETTIYRMVQEAISNSRKHAESARVSLRIVQTSDSIQIAYSDFGKGYDYSQAPKGVGLSSMRERAELLGGWLQMGSNVGVGSWLKGSLPLSPPAQGEPP